MPGGLHMKMLRTLLFLAAFLTLLTPLRRSGAQNDVEDTDPPPLSRYGYLPIAKIDGPIQFDLSSQGRDVVVNLALHPGQRSPVAVTTVLTDTSCCFMFEPTFDRVRPPRLGFVIGATKVTLLFAYSGDTASYRVSQETDSTGVVRLAVDQLKTAPFIEYAPDDRREEPDRKEH